VAKLPPNLIDAYETELAGLEARLALADDIQRAALEQRIADVRATLGVATETKAKRAAGRQTRPAGGDTEARG